MKKPTKNAAWSGLKVFLVCISVLKLFVPTFNLFYEEEIMGFLTAFDSSLFIWVIYIWILGQTLKKVSLPKWMPPTPVLLLLASFTICSLFGWAHTTATGAKAVFVAVVEYGLGNGILVWLFSTGSYDIFYTFMRDKWDDVKCLASKLWVNLKKKVEEKKALKASKKEAKEVKEVQKEVQG